MTLKRPAASKRTAFPRSSDCTKSFQSDWERLSRSGRYDMNRLKEAMLLLVANNGLLEPEWRDHSLDGDWVGYRECHVGGGCLSTSSIMSGRREWLCSSVLVPILSCSNKAKRSLSIQRQNTGLLRFVRRISGRFSSPLTVQSFDRKWKRGSTLKNARTGSSTILHSFQ